MDIHSAISKSKGIYANHPCIIETKKVTKNETAFSFKEVEEEKILKLLKNILLTWKYQVEKISDPQSLLDVLLPIYASL